jgi:two-component system chemotaxis response regulator CheY
MGAPAQDRFARLSFLVVDDNQHMCTIITTVLRSFGVRRILEAHGVEEAFQTFQIEPVDIIIADLHMEPHTGLDLLKLVRTAADSPNRFVPVIMITAHTARAQVMALRDAGANEVVRKPLIPANLYKKIIAVVNSPRTFIRTPNYFGPDRRRSVDIEYDGPERRQKTGTGNPWEGGQDAGHEHQPESQ